MGSGFCEWVHWEQRLALPQKDGAGVYMLAQFEGAPPMTTDPTDERVILIAETHDQSLAQRWRQFDYSARTGGDGHAGGKTFWKLYGNGAESVIPGWLFVAAKEAPHSAGDVRAHAQSEKEELLREFELRHGLLPRCNVRGPSSADARGLQGSSGDVAATDIIAAAPHVSAVAFSRWMPWHEREALDGLAAAGVYALARFEGGAPEGVDVLDERTIYLGETCDNSLRGRLGQFNRSAFGGKDGHSGGWTYRQRFGPEDGRSLYLSVFPVPRMSEPYRSAFIRHVERDVLWRYVQRWSRRPFCNSK